ncbi:MAG: hypothetical protein RL385_572 [Pseudomonadota bacterium]|jgi:hypothetical protein
MRSKFSLSACLATAFILLSPEHGAASPLLELAGGATGTGGLDGRSVSGGSSAAYFNPALLDDAPQGLTLGAVLVDSSITIHGLSRSASADVPNKLGNAYHADQSRWDSYPLGTDALQNGVPSDGLRSALPARPRLGAGSGQQTITYEAIGLVVRLFRQRLTLGYHGLIPNAGFTQLRGFYVDEREQFFSNSLHPELYSDRLLSLAMAMAGAVRITDTLVVGVGTTLSMMANVNAPVYVVDAGRLQDVMLNTRAKVNMGLAPHLGVAYRPHKRLRLTATVHAPQRVEFNVKFKFLLATGVEQSSGVRFVHDYMPWQVGLGGSLDVLQRPSDTITLHGSALYGRWSQYIDRHGERPSAAYPFSDTMTIAAGARYCRGPLSLGITTQYKPTPVPAQTGRSNYVDNDRVGASLSVEYGFTLWDTAARVGAQLAGHRLLQRSQRKLSTPTFADGQNHTPALVSDEVPDDAILAGEPLAGREGLQTNNPGWPGFSSAGFISTGGLYLTVIL